MGKWEMLRVPTQGKTKWSFLWSPVVHNDETLNSFTIKLAALNEYRIK